MGETALKRRARRALERQLDYQRRKADRLQGNEARIIAGMAEHSAAVRAKLNAVMPISREAKVLEVGSGAHGLIFFFDAAEKVGVDPLADHYRELFPVWQSKAKTLAAFGENLPFAAGAFDIVLSDNVVDHAEDPRRILEEMVRVLKPGGLLYFTVNVHHPLYHWAASLHAAWKALGIRFEITPFADHTVHFTPGSGRALFDGLPLRLVEVSDTVAETRAAGRDLPVRHAGDKLKRWFFKNAQLEVIAIRA
jgi:SAM-dependent methyltransferase